MASDPGVYGIFNRPTTELLDPWELERRKMAIANSLATQQLQQQQITGGAMALDQQQRAIAQQEQTRNALRAYYLGGAAPGAPAAAAADPGAPPPAAALPPGPGPGPGSAAWDPSAAAPAIAAAAPGPPPAAAAPGPPAPLSTEVPSIASLIKAGVDPIAAPAVLTSFQNAAKETATIQDLRDKTNVAVNNYASHMAAGVLKTGLNPAVLSASLQHFATLGPAYAQRAQEIATMFQRSPAAGKSLLESIAGSSAEGRAAASREAEVASTVGKNDRENLDAQVKQAGAMLATVPNQGAWNAVLSRYSPDVQKAFADIPWSPNAPKLAQARSMSGAEQATTAGAAETRAEAARHNKVEEGIRNLEASLSQKRLNWEQTGGATLDNPVYMAGVVDGTIQINPRDKNFAETEARAKQIDKTWSADRFNNRKVYMQSVTSGALGRELTSINQGLAHLGEYKYASDRVGVLGAITPGAGKVSGDVQAFMDARDTSGHELTTMFSQGQGTQSETHQTQDNLHSWTQSARNTGVNQYAKLIGGRVRALAKKHVSATGQAFPVDQFIDSSAIDFLKSQGVDVYKVAGDESKSWMNSHGNAGDGGAPAAAAPHGIPDLGSTFNGGRVLKVTPIP